MDIANVMVLRAAPLLFHVRKGNFERAWILVRVLRSLPSANQTVYVGSMTNTHILQNLPSSKSAQTWLTMPSSPHNLFASLSADAVVELPSAGDCLQRLPDEGELGTKMNYLTMHTEMAKCMRREWWCQSMASRSSADVSLCVFCKARQANTRPLQVGMTRRDSVE
jgi:hypothetical protein